MSATSVTATVRPPLWRNIRVLRVLGQAVFVAAVLIVGRELYLNMAFELRRQNLDLGFDFLRQRAGFGIKEGLVTYTPNHPYTRALLVGVVNTITVALSGILLATVLGLVAGVARLSSNWLVRNIARVYVETIRNTPVLIQIIFWYVAVILALPVIGGGSLWGVAYLSNRGAAIPWFRIREGAGAWALFLLAAVVVAAVVWRVRTRRSELTGEPHHRVAWSAALFVAVAAVGYVVVGDPVFIDEPDLGPAGRGYVGGLQLSGEFAAVLIALVIYTAAFIAEIVRGSILAVDRGQKEAAEAMGLTRFQQLRFVVLPQAMRIAIPPINSQYLNLTKNSSLAVAVAYPELSSVASTMINQAGRPFQIIVIVMTSYLVLSLVISFFMNLLNRAVAFKGVRR